MGYDENIVFYSKFALGGASGMTAWCFVHPLDLVKNRMQMMTDKSRTSMLTTMVNIVQKEGFRKLYTGMSAGLLRQGTYTTIRLGIYNVLFDKLAAKNNGRPPKFHEKALCATIAGSMGAIVGTPADVSIIRMSTDGMLPLAKRRGYTSVFNALARIIKEEGVATLWRGAIPTMSRAVVVNIAQLSTYSQAKEYVYASGHIGQGVLANFLSAMMSGLFTVTVSMPLDLAKTRIQNMNIKDGKPEFKSMLDVLIKTSKADGPRALWKGFVPAYFRQGPLTVLTLLIFEQFNKVFKNVVIGSMERRRQIVVTNNMDDCVVRKATL